MHCPFHWSEISAAIEMDLAIHICRSLRSFVLLCPPASFPSSLEVVRWLYGRRLAGSLDSEPGVHNASRALAATMAVFVAVPDKWRAGYHVQLSCQPLFLITSP